jgi:hypothetical protein
MICKHFGPGLHTHLTPSSIAFVAAGLFLLIWPASLKAKH